jgi:hypothetical protein
MKSRTRISTRGRRRPDLTLSRVRSAITNGSSLLADVDHRSAWMRRLRDLVAAHVSDLGGEAALSAAERVLVRRASMLCLQCEMMENRWNENNGEASPKSLETYQRVVGALRRTLEALGLERRARDIDIVREREDREAGLIP